MGDARGELAKRGELLRLDQPVLRLAQVVERGGELARARLDLAEEPSVFDRDERLVGEGATISIWRAENGEGSGAGKSKDALDLTVAQKGHAEGGAVIADARRLAEVVVRIGEYVREWTASPLSITRPVNVSRPARIGCS